MIIASIKDRKELQTLAIIKAETAAMKKGVQTKHAAGILAQALHLAWQGGVVHV